MSQNKIIGIALLVLGIALVYFGYNASNSPVEELSEAVTGKYSDETTFYLIGGAISAVIGIVMLSKK